MKSKIEGIPSSTTDLGQSEEHTPNLTLVAETIFTNGLQLGVTDNVLVDCFMAWTETSSCHSVARDNIQTSRLERSTWDLVGY